MPEVYYDSALTGEELDTALKKIPLIDAAVEAAQKSAQGAESWARGGTGTREGENEDNAEYWAGQAKANAESTAADTKVVKDNRPALQAIGENLGAILSAADNALAAQGFAEDSATSAEIAQKAAELAQSIAQGAQGYYPTADKLSEDHPEGQNGQWAIVGDTDTIWVWDSDTSAWVNSGQRTDLSKYYTKDQTDAELDELQTAMSQALAEAIGALSAVAKSGSYSDLTDTPTALPNPSALNFTGAVETSYDGSGAVSVDIPPAARAWRLAAAPSGWSAQDDGSYTQTVTAAGMTAAVRLAPAIGCVTSGSPALADKKALAEALGCISEASSGEGSVTLTCYEQPPAVAVTVLVYELPQVVDG